MAGLLEGITRGIGRAIAEAGGTRETRTAGLTAPETRILSGVLSASGTGTAVTFSPSVPDPTTVLATDGSCIFRVTSNTAPAVIQTAQCTGSELGTRVRITTGVFAADVLPGRTFAITAGPLNGRSAKVNKRVSDIELLLDGLGIEIDFPATNFSVTFALVSRFAPIVAKTGSNPVTGVTLAYELGPTFTSQSWEIVRRAGRSVTVESTLDWPSAGESIVGRTRYRYRAKTLTTLDALVPSAYVPSAGHIIVVAGASLVDGETVTIDDGRGQVTTFEFDAVPYATAPGNIPVRFTAVMTANDVRDALIERIRYTMPEVAAFAGPGTGHVELRPYDASGFGSFDVVDTVAAATFLTPGPRGVAVESKPLEAVVDFSGTYSAVDIYRNSFIVDRATGDDLSRLGRAVGMPRPSGLNDDTLYRNLVKATAYAPRGTIYAIEQALDAVLGVGNWELFEDLTLGSFNHGATVFLRRTDGLEFDSVGKTFLGGTETRPMTTTTTLSLAATPLRTGGLRYTDEGGDRLVADGTALLGLGVKVALGPDQTATAETASPAFPASAVLPGDLLVTRLYTAVIRSQTSTTELVLGPVTGAPNLAATLAGKDLDWQIIRPKSDFRLYLPSAESQRERSGGPLAATWTVSGAGTETLTAGTKTRIVTAPAQTKLYTRSLRVEPESTFAISVTLDMTKVIDLESGGPGCFQVRLSNGEKIIAVTVVKDDVDAWRYVRFTDGVVLLTGRGNGRIDVPTYCDITIRRGVEGWVEVFVDGSRVLAKDYASFPSAATRELVFGNFAEGTTDIRSLAFAIKTPRDFWNTRLGAAATTTAAESIVDVSAPFLLPDAGARHVRITDFGALNTAGGSARGEWFIDTVASTTGAHVTGPTRTRGFFRDVGVDGGGSRFFVRDSKNAFIWPDVRGHAVEILDGPNAGVYAITRVLDPVTLIDVEEPRLASHGASPKLAVFAPALSAPTGTFPKVTVYATLGGLVASVTVTAGPDGVLQTTGFDADSIVAVKLTDVAETVDAVFEGEVSVYVVPASVTVPSQAFLVGTKVIALPPRARSYGGRAQLVASSATWTSNSAVSARFSSNVVELDTAGGSPPRPDGFSAAADETRYRIIPSFPSGAVAGEVSDTGTQSGAALTLRKPITITPAADYPVVAARTVTVRSAYLTDRRDVNQETAPGVYAFYPFYLNDAFGLLRQVIDLLAAAGVHVDYDHLIRNDAGLHLID